MQSPEEIAAERRDNIIGPSALAPYVSGVHTVTPSGCACALCGAGIELQADGQLAPHTCARR